VRAVLRQRNFVLLWTAGVVSALGDWILNVGLPFYVYERTGSVLATATMLAARTLPALLLGPLAGVLVDRWDRRRTMIGSDVARAALLLLLLAVPATDQLWPVYAVAVLEAAAGQLFAPASGALLPRLLRSPDDLPAANALLAQGAAVAQLVGPSIGGLLIVWVGLTPLVLLDSASYALSAALVSLVAVAPDRRPTPPPAARSIWQESLDGVRVVRRAGPLAGLFCLTVPMVVAEGVWHALLVVFVADVLHAGAVGYAWMRTAQGISGLLGGVVVGALANRVPLAALISGGALLFGGLFLVMASAPHYAVALVAYALTGVPGIAWRVGTRALLQRESGDAHLGRVLAAYGALQTTFFLAGQLAAAALGATVGVRPMLVAAAALIVGAGLAAPALLGRAARR
jgi:predicted MFS family arabinose efflux permease